MHPFLKDFLYFNKAQRKGILILLAIIVAALFYLEYSSLFVNSHQPIRTDIEWISIRDSSDENSVQHKQNDEIVLSPFNPNQIGLKDWMRMGLSKAQAQSILNYQAKGGYFSIKSDLKKMYTISEEKYEEIYPYIDLPDKIEVEKKEVYASHEKKEAFILDINLADSSDWVRLKGIGPVYSSRIVKYRNALGGFYSKDQLSEVWGLPDSTIDKIQSQLKITDFELETMDLNAASVEELAKHPYLNWKEANAIVRYREEHGAFDDLHSLKKIYLLRDSIIHRIFPYLEVNLEE